MKRFFVAASLALLGCETDAPVYDMATVDMAAYPRTLVTRSLMPTSVQNLLRDPLIGGDNQSSYGQFRAFFDDGNRLGLSRTFRSVSPVGGLVAIEQVNGSDGHESPPLYVSCSFLGGPGMFHASILVSAGDANGKPVPFATAASSVAVNLLDNQGEIAERLVVVGDPVMYGDRQWVRFESSGMLALPMGGTFVVEIDDLSVSLQLAEPEVTSSALSGPSPHREAKIVKMSDRQRRVMVLASRLDRQPQRRETKRTPPQR